MRTFKSIARVAVFGALLALSGFATADADDMGPGPIMQNGHWFGQYVTGTNGEKHFRGVEGTLPVSTFDPSGDICGSIIDTATFKGQRVCGTDNSVHIRGVSGNYSSQPETDTSDDTVYPGGESIPIYPGSCLDTQGRHRLPPCRGN